MEGFDDTLKLDLHLWQQFFGDTDMRSPCETGTAPTRAIGTLRIGARVPGGGAPFENYVIVKAILAMAISLGLSVTAEGVETLQQANVLREMGCQSLQGYYFGKPMPANEMDELLAKDALNSQHWAGQSMDSALTTV